LDTCLTYKNDIIVLEAAKVLCSLEQLTSEELTPAVKALQSFLSSMKPVQKFAAIRILNELANRYPILVSLCNNDIEGLIVDTNSHTATLAITTLLKIGKETNIDKLMKQISQFINEIPDEFRIVVVDAIRSLCLKFPSKHHALISFLSNALRDEGGYEYKRSIVETIIELSQAIPESKENAISYLCEFIEDCEFTLLLQRVLHFLGKEAPKSENPAKCIRFIYNRVMLENAPVRACAVITLAKFAAQLPSLRPSIIDILKRIFSDQDDEVRDRAVFYVRVLENGDDNLINSLIVEDLPVDTLSLEHSLLAFLRDEEPQAEFDLSQVVEVEKREQAIQQGKKPKIISASPNTPSAEPSEAVPVAVTSYEDIFNKIPQLSSLGKPFKSCQPEFITEEDSDYVVTVIKHIYPEHIVFQFNVTNKVESQQLEAVHVEMTESSETDLQQEFFVEANAIKYEQCETCFVCMKRTDPDSFVSTQFTNVLKFKVRNVDTETREAEDTDLADLEEDEYDLQEFRVNVTDFVRRTPVSSFKEEWDKLENEEYGDTAQYATGKSLQECVDEVVQLVGMAPMNDTKITKKNNHSLYFSGKFTNGKCVLLAVQLALSKEDVVMIKVASRSEDETIRQLMANILLQG
jgi:coatomer protein complex subunit gamma